MEGYSIPKVELKFYLLSDKGLSLHERRDVLCYYVSFFSYLVQESK
jgi:hypothetical protein